MSVIEAEADPGRQVRTFSVCVFCGSSGGARPEYVAAAKAFGRILAEAEVRLVYGGGGIGLMGATAKSAHAAGGRVLGVMPDFLRRHEVVYDEVETVVVSNMHERKRLMFDSSDAIAVFPGGIGTLEEVVELMSWRRLDLHRKPVVFLNLAGFWNPLFELMDHMVREGFAPSWLPETWAAVTTVEDILPAVRRLRLAAPSGPGFFGYPPSASDLAQKS